MKEESKNKVDKVNINNNKSKLYRNKINSMIEKKYKCKSKGII